MLNDAAIFLHQRGSRNPAMVKIVARLPVTVVAEIWIGFFFFATVAAIFFIVLSFYAASPARFRFKTVCACVTVCNTQIVTSCTVQCPFLCSSNDLAAGVATPFLDSGVPRARVVRPWPFLFIASCDWIAEGTNHNLSFWFVSQSQVRNSHRHDDATATCLSKAVAANNTAIKWGKISFEKAFVIMVTVLSLVFDRRARKVRICLVHCHQWEQVLFGNLLMKI